MTSWPTYPPSSAPVTAATGAVSSRAITPTPAVKVIDVPAAGMLPTDTLLAEPSYFMELGLLASEKAVPGR